MASYIIKSKGSSISNAKEQKVTIGRFYSGDRFYTLLNEYIDSNLHRRSKLLAWIIKCLFRSSNYKHDPGIANGQPWSVKLFDIIGILMVILFICFGGLTIILPIIASVVPSLENAEWIKAFDFSAGGGGAITFLIITIISGIIGITWLVIYLLIRRKNKPLSLQAFVEKKISFILLFRFIIKNTTKISKPKDQRVFLLENFEAQGASGARWLNIQMINLVCSIIPDFNYMFKFDELSDADHEELLDVMTYDFKQIEIINSDNLEFNKYVESKKIDINSNKSDSANQPEAEKE